MACTALQLGFDLLEKFIELCQTERRSFWPSDRTIMLRNSSKKLRQIMSYCHLPTAIAMRLKIPKESDADSSSRTRIPMMATKCPGFRLLQKFTMDASMAIVQLEILEYNLEHHPAQDLAAVLRNCSSLDKLNLNNIDSTVDWFDVMEAINQPSLSSLELTRSRVNTDALPLLAESLSQCSMLTTLCLRENLYWKDRSPSQSGINTFTQALQGVSTTLRRLELTHDRCTSGTASLDLGRHLYGQLSLLTHLDISQSSIMDTGAQELAFHLQDCTSLTHLELKANKIGAIGLRHVLGAIGTGCTGLSHLGLCHNLLGDEGCTNMAEWLDCVVDASAFEGPSLKHLLLGENWIKVDGMRALSGALGKCQQLQELSFAIHTQSLHVLGPEGAEILAEALKHCSCITILDITGNQIKSQGASALAQGLEGHRKLRWLDVSANAIGDLGATGLAGLLVQCTKLQRLDLSYNRVKDQGFIPICQALKQTTDLTYLDVRDMECTAEGVTGLAESMRHWPNLSYLDLSHARNRISWMGDLGATSLASALHNCSKLEYLSLEGNRIETAGMKALVFAIQHCPELRSLMLASNEIGDDGTCSLAEQLEAGSACQKLVFIDINENGIGERGALAIFRVAAKPRVLTTLHSLKFGMNDIGERLQWAMTGDFVNLRTLSRFGL